jgi:hypothetical protein
MRHNDGDEERCRCGLCGKVLRPYDSISVTDVGERCYRCFNEELADRLGIAFDNTPIAPIVVADADGVRHRFEIRSMLVGTGHAMYAREVGIRDAAGGYRFEILGEGLVSLLGDLYDVNVANGRFLHSRLTPGSRDIGSSSSRISQLQLLACSSFVPHVCDRRGTCPMKPLGGGVPVQRFQSLHRMS